MSDQINQKDREAICRLVGHLLNVDGEFTRDERAFLDNLMRRYRLDNDAQERITASLDQTANYTQEVESLRRSGLSQALLDELQAAAMADGVLAPEEKAMIHRINRIITYRLGVDDGYMLQLEHLNTAPLSECYQLQEKLGEGGFSEVFKAKDLKSQRLCVVKKLKANFDVIDNSKLRASMEDRFWREVLLISKLRNPHTIRLLDAGFDVDVPYMVLEFLEGPTLHEFLYQRPLTLPETRALMIQALEALAEAHELGIVHRDLKPANIMFADNSRAVTKILDFGLSGIVEALQDEQHYSIMTSQEALGTPPYMAPEQVLKSGVARRETDIYGLGLILSECLTQQMVYDMEKNYDIMRAQISPKPVPFPRDILEGPFGPILRRACDKRWQCRFGPPEEHLKELIELEKLGRISEASELQKKLYNLHNPADEMISALKELRFDGEAPITEPPQRKGLVRFLRRMIGKSA